VRVRLTDQAAVAVTLARNAAGAAEPTVAHLLLGLVAEPDGQAGRRLRERATAAATLSEHAAGAQAPPIEAALSRAGAAAPPRAATTVDLLDAAIVTGGADIAALLEEAGYQRDLDGWLVATEWFDNAETYGFSPVGDDAFDRSACRVLAQVRAINGGAVELLIAAMAAPDARLDGPDPRVLASIASRLQSDSPHWDAGLAPVVAAVTDRTAGIRASIRDLVQAAVMVGGDGPRLVLQLASDEPDPWTQRPAS
jgi:hypothetical protein